MSILQNIFDSADLQPHGICLLWRPELIWLHVLSDSLIALSYFSIPVALAYFISKRKDLAYRWVFALFAAFILACGTTHLFGIWTLWSADYGTQGAIKAFTAIVSVLTAGLLWPLLPQALALPSPAVLRHMNEALSLQVRERDRTAATLRESEERFRNLYNRTPAPLHSVDSEARLVGVSDYWIELLGYERDWALGRSIVDLHTEASALRFRDELWPELLDSGELRDAEIQMVARDGRVLDLLLSARVERTENGMFQRALGVLVDITARKEAERALRRQTDFNEQLIGSSSEGIVAFDRDLRFRVWNPAMEQISGLAAHRVVGRTLAEALPPFVGTRSAEAMQAATRGERTKLLDQAYAVPESGRSGYFEADYAPLRDHAGAVVGGIGLVRDITERQRMESSLREAQKMEAIGRLTGGVAHDFNNLLTVVLGNLDLAARRAEDERLGELLLTATRAAERGAKVTSQLLAFSRRQSLQPVPVDIERLLGNMADLLAHSLGEPVSVEREIADDLWRAMVDPNQLELVILNLAINARDAMPGGGTLRVRAANQPAGSGPLPDDLVPGDFVRLTVADSGTGMSADVLARAFEPFFTTKGVGKGSGLGLSQVYGVAKQSGGSVSIDSSPGAGTRVTIWLPRAQLVPQADSGHDTRPLAARPQRVSVLLIDDDPEVRRTAADMLGGLGFTVHVAEDGRSGLAKLDETPEVSLLLVDFAMPGMNGVEVLRRARERRPALISAMVTGYAEAEALRDTDGIPILRKPFRLQELFRFLMEQTPAFSLSASPARDR